MTQTTGAVAQSCGQVEVSFDGCDSYVDVSGQVSSLIPGAQARMSGEAYTLSGDTAIVKGGKREPMELTFVIVYTETDAEIYEQARALFEGTECGADMCVRWSPGGGNAGDEIITTDTGVLVSFTYPNVDAATAGPILGGFTAKVPGTTTTIVAS